MRLLAAFLVATLLAGCTNDAGLDRYGCPDSVGLDAEITLGNAFASARLDEPTKATTILPIADAADAPSWVCFDRVEITITWTNQIDQGGDLYVGYDADGETIVGHDEQQLVLDGSHEETVVGPAPDQGDATELTVHIYSDWAVLSATGLPVQIHVSIE